MKLARWGGPNRDVPDEEGRDVFAEAPERHKIYRVCGATGCRATGGLQRVERQGRVRTLCPQCRGGFR